MCGDQGKVGFHRGQLKDKLAMAKKTPELSCAVCMGISQSDREHTEAHPYQENATLGQ